MDFSDVMSPLYQETSFEHLSPSIHWAQFHITQKDHEYSPRRIYDYELLYVQKGRITAFIGEERMSISAGELLFIRAGVVHHLKVESAPEACFLGIHFDFFDELKISTDEDIIVHEGSFERQWLCREPKIAGFQPLSTHPVIIPSAQTIADMEQLIEEFNLHQPGFKTVCEGLMLQILIRLFRAQIGNTHAKGGLYTDQIMALAKWIQFHYDKDCTNPSLAAIVSLNEDYMAKQFKATLGMPPGKYVQTVRHREAKKLLKDTDDLVEKIGRQVGYPDIHYFSRIFRKLEGISPSEYRKLSRIY